MKKFLFVFAFFMLLMGSKSTFAQSSGLEDKAKYVIEGLREVAPLDEKQEVVFKEAYINMLTAYINAEKNSPTGYPPQDIIDQLDADFRALTQRILSADHLRYLAENGVYIKN